MNPIKWTIGIIIAVTLALIGWDIYVAVNNVPNSLDTISGRMRIWAFSTPIIPWVWCGLSGHFFGPFHQNQFMPIKTGIGLLIFCSWAVIWFGILLRSRGIIVPPWTMCVPAFLVWSILWAQ